eukprot:6635305-Prymnesium_polylepis.1
MAPQRPRNVIRTAVLHAVAPLGSVASVMRFAKVPERSITGESRGPQMGPAAAAPWAPTTSPHQRSATQMAMHHA